MKKFLSPFLCVVICIEILVPIGFATMAILNPSFIDANLTEVTPALALYIVRNYAIALGLLLSVLWLRSYAAVFALIVVRMLMDIPDIINSLLVGASDDILASLPVFIVLLIILPAVALRKLWPKVQEG